MIDQNVFNEMMEQGFITHVDLKAADIKDIDALIELGCATNVDADEVYEELVNNFVNIKELTDKFLEDVKNGGKVIVPVDLELSDYIEIKNDVTIDLNGHDINANCDYAIKVYDGNLTIEGTGHVNAIHTAVCSLGGNVDIHGGNYVAGKDGAATIYAYDGSINISNGCFEATEMSEGMKQYSVLNCKDNVGTIVVTGGKFKNFDPANNLSEGPNTNFVADGFESVNDGDWYVVRPVVEVVVDEVTE